MRSLLRTWCVVVMLSCGRGYAPDGSLENGEKCRASMECASGYCQRLGGNDFSTCENRCRTNGSACGPSGRFDNACCSGYCSQSGTCSI